MERDVPKAKAADLYIRSRAVRHTSAVFAPASCSLRHYNDVCSLLRRPEVQAFIGTAEYQAHKTKRFRGGDNPNIAQNQAFILADPETRKVYAKAFSESSALYYGDKPTFEEILKEIGTWVDRL